MSLQTLQSTTSVVYKQYSPLPVQYTTSAVYILCILQTVQSTNSAVYKQCRVQLSSEVNKLSTLHQCSLGTRQSRLNSAALLVQTADWCFSHKVFMSGKILAEHAEVLKLVFELDTCHASCFMCHMLGFISPMSYVRTQKIQHTGDTESPDGCR